MADVCGRLQFAVAALRRGEGVVWVGELDFCCASLFGDGGMSLAFLGDHLWRWGGGSLFHHHLSQSSISISIPLLSPS
jgi:hypothetical protein